MFKKLFSQPLFSRPSLSNPLTTISTPPLRPFTTTTKRNMPLITSTGKPRIILGTMTFGPDESEGARITDINDYNKILDRFQSAGYNEIDTARVYVGGKQEAFTREAKWKERGLTCATKWYPHTPGAHKPEVIEEKLNESLKELGTDCIDIFYLHAADRSVPFQQTLEKLNELHKQGKFVQLGLSNFTAFEVAEVVMHCKYNNWVRPTIYQGMVSRDPLFPATSSSWSQTNLCQHSTTQSPAPSKLN
jgi:aflatoxin B1 aldehyde reductase